jgi:hypothetical protein
MNRFPFSKLKIKDAKIQNSLAYNPLADYEPKVRWSITLEIAPIDLSDSACLDSESTVESDILLDDLELDISSLNDLAGSFSFSEQQNGSFYVSWVHNPVDVIDLELRKLEDNKYQVDAKVQFFFEHESSGFQDEVVQLSFMATYIGFKFDVPHWTNPEAVDLPEEWNVPSTAPQWTDEQLRTFVSQYLDLSEYPEVEIRDGKELLARLRPTS